jgi:UDP-glucose 4-epimerase
MIRLMAHADAIGEVFNIGSQEEVTVRQLAERIRTRVGSHSPITHIPYDQAYQPGFEDMMRRVPSLEKIKRLIAFTPTRGLDEIIDSVTEFYRQSKSTEQHRKVRTNA